VLLDYMSMMRRLTDARSRRDSELASLKERLHRAEVTLDDFKSTHEHAIQIQGRMDVIDADLKAKYEECEALDERIVEYVSFLLLSRPVLILRDQYSQGQTTGRGSRGNPFTQGRRLGKAS